MQNLLKTYVIIGPDHSAIGVDVTTTIWEDLEQHFERFQGRLLVAKFDFEMDWPSWEMHPHGDEVVVLLSGYADMILDQAGNHQVSPLTQPGSFIIVPKGTWHTARISAPTSMLFITPGQGTENRPT